MATCETNGHLYGSQRACIMCGEAKPQEQLPSNELVSKLRDIAKGAFPVSGAEHCTYWRAANEIDRLNALNLELSRANAAECLKLQQLADERKREIDDLNNEIQKLQIALAFWLPNVPTDDAELAERAGNDAFLLAGLDADVKSAEELGWVRLRGALPPADILRQGALFARAIEFLEEIRNAAGDEWPVLNEFLDGLPSTKPDYEPCYCKGESPAPCKFGNDKPKTKANAPEVVSQADCDEIAQILRQQRAAETEGSRK